jgi:hypothetical protein
MKVTYMRRVAVTDDNIDHITTQQLSDYGYSVPIYDQPLYPQVPTYTPEFLLINKTNVPFHNCEGSHCDTDLHYDKIKNIDYTDATGLAHTVKMQQYKKELVQYEIDRCNYNNKFNEDLTMVKRQYIKDHNPTKQDSEPGDELSVTNAETLDKLNQLIINIKPKHNKVTVHYSKSINTTTPFYQIYNVLHEETSLSLPSYDDIIKFELTLNN